MMRRYLTSFRRILGTGLFLILCFALSAYSASHHVLRNIEYAAVDGISLLLDLYLPDPKPAEPVPLVLWIHGGAWRAGSKDTTYAPETLGGDYAVASVDYRLSDVALFPAQIHDVKAAVRFLRANADRFGIDPDRFGAWGSSAGGHLVALLGTTCGDEALEGAVGGNLDQSSCIQAVCDFYGPTDFAALLDQRGENTRRPMPEDHLIGGSVEDLTELAELASPIAHVSADDPPFLIMHGSDDGTVPVEQSIALDVALREAGVDSTLIVIEGAGHSIPKTERGPVVAFFDRWLRAEPAASQGSPTALHQSGQTFLTWEEEDASRFAVYRSPEPLGSASDLLDMDRLAIIAAGSARNDRASDIEARDVRYVIPGDVKALAGGTGLFVHTALETAAVYYAIAACDAAGSPAEWIGAVGPIEEQVAPPQAVLQSRIETHGRVRAHYVHWAPHVDTSAAQALTNRSGLAFNLAVWETAEDVPGGAAVFSLHGGGGAYANAIPDSAHPALVFLGLDSHIHDFPPGLNGTGDAWYGYNENVGTGQPLSEGLNVDYTTRRLRWTAAWLVSAYPSIDPDRLFLRGSSMGGVGTLFSAILLRDVFAAGLSIVPHVDYSADGVGVDSADSFAARWGTRESNLATSEGLSTLDRLSAIALAHLHPEWDFAPVWMFNGRNDTVVGWSEKVPFYEAMQTTHHGWAFHWDLRGHGGRSTDPRAWRENGTEEETFAWMVENLHLDQSYPGFSACSIDDDPGAGDPTDGDPIGTINGTLRWNPATIEETEDRWSIELQLLPDASASDCTVDVTPRRLQRLIRSAGTRFDYTIQSLQDDAVLASGQVVADENGLVTVPAVPVNAVGVRLALVAR